MSDPNSSSRPEDSTPEKPTTGSDPIASTPESDATGAPTEKVTNVETSPEHRADATTSTPSPETNAVAGGASASGAADGDRVGQQDAATERISHGAESDAQTQRMPSTANDEPAEEYPVAREAEAARRDRTVTEAYSTDAQTEHLITGPEPTAAYDTAPADERRGTVLPASNQYVELPEEPKRKGNRWAGIGIGLIQAVFFAAALFGVLVLLRVLGGEALDPLAIALSPAFLIAVGMFFIGLILVALIVNRAGWWSWVLGGLFIAIFAYAGWIGGSLVQDAMSVPSNRVLQYVLEQLLTWPAIAAFILGREIPIWFGAWTSARGRRVAARNREARDEYERKLDESV